MSNKTILSRFIKMLNYYSVTNNTLVLAGVVGFEPTNHGIKTRCLTPWLHPKGPLIRFNSVILRSVLWTVKQTTIELRNNFQPITH